MPIERTHLSRVLAVLVLSAFLIDEGSRIEAHQFLPGGGTRHPQSSTFSDRTPYPSAPLTRTPISPTWNRFGLRSAMPELWLWARLGMELANSFA